MPTVLFYDYSGSSEHKREHKSGSPSMADRIARFFSPRFQHCAIEEKGYIHTWHPDQGATCFPAPEALRPPDASLDVDLPFIKLAARRARGCRSVALSIIFNKRFWNCSNYCSQSLGIKRAIRTPDQLYQYLKENKHDQVLS